VRIHPQIAARAIEPRYTVPEASSFIARPTSTVRRWAIGNVRRDASGAERRDEPLIRVDGDPLSYLPLSFLNLLELRFLSAYRSRVPLQSIRRALEFAAEELHVPRPLLTLEFKAKGKSLFLRFATEGEDPYLLNASRRGQLAWPSALDDFIESVDYDPREKSAFRWWPLGRDEPIIVDTLLNGGLPSTARSGVRTQAIALQRSEGFEVREIAYDVSAAEDEVRAALRFERAA